MAAHSAPPTQTDTEVNDLISGLSPEERAAYRDEQLREFARQLVAEARAAAEEDFNRNNPPKPKVTKQSMLASLRKGMSGGGRSKTIPVFNVHPMQMGAGSSTRAGMSESLLPGGSGSDS